MVAVVGAAVVREPSESTIRIFPASAAVVVGIFLPESNAKMNANTSIFSPPHSSTRAVPTMEALTASMLALA